MANNAGFISNLPMGFQDEVVLIFLKMDFSEQMVSSKLEDLRSGGHYITDLAEPYFLPIFGEYDDFGKIDEIEETDVTEYISKFFDMEITEIVDTINRNASRINEKTLPSKNPEIFEKLTYCLEHRGVYEGMLKMKNPLINEFGITGFMLSKIGLDNTDSNVWVADGMDYEFMLGTLSVTSYKDGKKCDDFHYGRQFIKFLLENGYDKSNMCVDIMNLTDIDLRYEKAKECVKLYKSLDPEVALREYMFGYPGVKMGSNTINKYLDKTSIDGKYSIRFDHEKIQHDIIGVIDDQTVKNFIEFHRVLYDMSIPYRACKTCSDYRDYEKHYELLKVTRDVIAQKMQYEMDETTDTIPGYEEALRDMGKFREDDPELVLG